MNLARASLSSLLALASAGLGLVFLTGCGLKPIEPYVCGNGVVEPEAREDCDQSSPHCGQKQSEAPCRFLCAADSECAEGYACGADGICRKPTGAFVEIKTTPASGIIGLAAGDINDDGCDDLVISTISQEIVDGFASRAPGRCAPIERSFRASLVPSELSFAAPVLATRGGMSTLVVADRGRFGEGLFELDIVDDDLTPRAHLGTQFHAGGAPINMATAARLGLADGTDAWISLAGAGPPMPGAPMGNSPSALFGVAYPSSTPEVINPSVMGREPLGVTLASGDLREGGCEELVIANADAPVLKILSLCASAPGGGLWDTKALPDVHLAAGARLPNTVSPEQDPHVVRQPSSTSIVMVDADGDGHNDILVNDGGGQIHVAYGLGDGRFHSTSPPANPPDQSTSVLADRSLWGITGDFVFTAWPGESPSSPAPHAVITPFACPTRAGFASPSCTKAYRSACRAAVGDIDGDGLPDVVFTEPELPNVLVYRSSKADGFLLSSHSSACPPRDVTVADVDGDGFDDIAFYDARVSDPSQKNAPVGSTLKVAFGSPSGAPPSPKLAAVFDPGLARPPDRGLARDQALVAGRFFGKGAPPDLAALFSIPNDVGMNATVDAGVAGARLEAAAGRQMIAPFYIPDFNAGGEPDGAAHIVQMARGRFTDRPTMAVITTNLPGDPEAQEALWLLDMSATTGASAPSSIPINCRGCAIATIDIEGDSIDELVALGDGTAEIYRASAMNAGAGFDAPAVLATGVDFSDPKAGQGGRMSRPVVADLDGDGHPDILAMTGEGALVAAWGTGGEALLVDELLAPYPCVDGGKPPCGARPSFALIEADGSALPEVVVASPGLVELYDLLPDRRFVLLNGALLGGAHEAPPTFSDYVSIVAGDFDGDGVDDIALARASSFFSLLRGLPAIE